LGRKEELEEKKGNLSSPKTVSGNKNSDRKVVEGVFLNCHEKGKEKAEVRFRGLVSLSWGCHHRDFVYYSSRVEGREGGNRLAPLKTVAGGERGLVSSP